MAQAHPQSPTGVSEESPALYAPHDPSPQAPIELQEPIAGLILYSTALLLVVLAVALLLATVLIGDDEDDPE